MYLCFSIMSYLSPRESKPLLSTCPRRVLVTFLHSNTFISSLEFRIHTELWVCFRSKNLKFYYLINQMIINFSTKLFKLKVLNSTVDMKHFFLQKNYILIVNMKLKAFVLESLNSKRKVFHS